MLTFKNNNTLKQFILKKAMRATWVWRSSETGFEEEIGNQNTVLNYSCYFQKVFYFCHRCRDQRPILITNSDREKCSPCALWVSCDLVRRRALVNTCPLLLINMTRGQKWPYAFHLVLLRVEFLHLKTLCARDCVVSSSRHVLVKYSLYNINSVSWHACLCIRDTWTCCILHLLNLRRFFSVFQSNSAQYAAEKRDEEKMCDHLIRAAKYRDHVTATQLIQKIVHILTDKHGAWGSSSTR